MTEFGHFGVTVENLDRSIAFYRDVFGFGAGPVVERPGEYAERLTGVPGARLAIVSLRTPGAIPGLRAQRAGTCAGSRDRST